MADVVVDPAEVLHQTAILVAFADPARGRGAANLQTTRRQRFGRWRLVEVRQWDLFRRRGRRGRDGREDLLALVTADGLVQVLVGHLAGRPAVRAIENSHPPLSSQTRGQGRPRRARPGCASTCTCLKIPARAWQRERKPLPGASRGPPLGLILSCIALP